MGSLIELIDQNPKKAISYHKAARTIESLAHFNKEIETHSLEDHPGIGHTLAKMIYTLVEQGYLPYYNHLRNTVPKTLLQLALIPGLTLNRIRILFEHFKITNLSELEGFLKNPSKLKGFTPYYNNKLLKNIARFKEQGPTLLYPKAITIAHAFKDKLKSFVKRIEITGPLRRKLEMVKEIDLLALTAQPSECISAFIEHSFVDEIIIKEKTKARVFLKQGVIGNIYAVEENFPYFLLLSTGSQIHVNELNKIVPIYNCIKTKKIKNESDIYKAIGLPYIEPELREGFGEIEAAKKGLLPKLIEEKDLRGVFHCHTLDSDGNNSIEEMAEGAKQLGWEYIGISDHSKSSGQANGMNEERLLAQIESIHQYNKQSNDKFYVFTGLECDILKDGQLDFPNEILQKLDFVIISVHRFFNLEEKEMTDRIIKAVENPYSTMVGHLTGRLLRHRDPYKVNVSKIIDACIANEKIIEINAYPDRLDMDWRYWIKAKEKGLKCAINPDAHSVAELQNYQYGINMARKGWLEKSDVINTLSLEEMIKFLTY